MGGSKPPTRMRKNAENYYDPEESTIWVDVSPITLPETNIEPENGWLEDFLVSFWVPAHFQVQNGC